MSTRASTRKRKATTSSSTRSTKKTKSSSDDCTYQVDALVDHRPDKDRGGYQYSIKWTGYDDPTWVHESDIVGINLIADYWHEIAQRVEAKLAEMEARERERGGVRSPGADHDDDDDDDAQEAAAVPARASSVDAPPVAANAPIDLVDNVNDDVDDNDDNDDVQVTEAGPRKRRRRSTTASCNIGAGAADAAPPLMPPDPDAAGDAPFAPRITEADIDHVYGFEDVPDPYTGESKMHAVFLLKDGNTTMFPVKEAAMWAPRFMCDYLIKHLHFTTPSADADQRGGGEAGAEPDDNGGGVGGQEDAEECKIELVGNDED
ncbi:hypothetical protein AMAG_02027 [Allomyces macrogynus ATCC 38327]|uniref:Chromo domain-containing protein n=1 Tax=Allomyces macrogynus (strain ATCC 38327) TaxID=578462 RepID=A0A0L0S0U0_ALLM3|nr:hypothetical protein AMAG_02027 [Allomyces macrogynus ATCC 38327]|eukprot:KNE56193.1 hypothetical protein AMAG_02027 [Allomyces macrogynus ATCC 38327]